MTKECLSEAPIHPVSSALFLQALHYYFVLGKELLPAGDASKKLSLPILPRFFVFVSVVQVSSSSSCCVCKTNRLLISILEHRVLLFNSNLQNAVSRKRHIISHLVRFVFFTNEPHHGNTVPDIITSSHIFTNFFHIKERSIVRAN